MIKKPSPRQDFYKLSEEVNNFWKKNKIFEKSLKEQPDDKRYVFIDGPPFVTGMPHYGSLLSSIAKDVITRYWATKGYKVRRVWGWDCHGLPIEEKVSEKFGLKSKQDIAEFGIAQYVSECRNHIEDITAQWRWYIDAVGRWVDMDNAYYTMKPEFNESVIWVFKQAWERGLVYKSKRVSLFSTDTATPVSEFEVAEADNYKDVDDLSIFVKFELNLDSKMNSNFNLPNKKAFLVAWTTTPWTIPSNFALAVNASGTYTAIEVGDEILIIAKDRLDNTLKDKEYTILKEFNGEQLTELSYKPVYDFFTVQSNPNDFKVYSYEGVSLDDGTGVLHIAPGFGAEDFELGQRFGLSDFQGIDDEGMMLVSPWAGTYLRDASKQIAKDLEVKGNLLRKDMYRHRLPFFRGNNPLIYKAQEAYFIDISKIKGRMLELNQKINWVPSHFKDGRFADVIKNAPDWCVSRTRYWATIMPIWKSADGEEIIVGSIEEMAKYNTDITCEISEDGRKTWYFAGQKLMLHRDICDQIVLEKDGKKFNRIPDVMDCWLDSGSVPIAEYHYPFENKELFEKNFPADFIAEYVGQIRAWFNVLLRVSTIVFDDIPFRNVIATGNMSGTDGRKMSKSFRNYPDPRETIEKYGGDALRLYLAGSPLMVGNDISFNEQDLKIQVQEIILPFWNTFSFLATYADIHNWSPSNDLVEKAGLKNEKISVAFKQETLNPLNQWVLNKLFVLINEFESSMQGYNTPATIKVFRETINEMSKWYIRNSREYFARGDQEFLEVLYYVMLQLSRISSSIIPFIAEEIYKSLTLDSKNIPESVHLTSYPTLDENIEISSSIFDEMNFVRQIIATGNELRAESNIKLRQPLESFFIDVDGVEIKGWMTELIQKELNVQTAIFSKPAENTAQIISKAVESQGMSCYLNIEISDELRVEGYYREITRKIQAGRKDFGLKQGELVRAKISIDPIYIDTFKQKRDEIVQATQIDIIELNEKDTEDILEIIFL